MSPWSDGATPRQRIDKVKDALAWMESRRGLWGGEIGDVCTLIYGHWEARERAHDDAIARLWEQRFAAARLRDFLNWTERELTRSDAEWEQLEARAARMNAEADAVLGEDANVTRMDDVAL